MVNLLPRRYKITISQAKGEGSGNLYHIEVRDSPFQRFQSISHFISLINNTKMQHLLKFAMINTIQNTTGQGCLLLDMCTIMLVLMHNQKMCACTIITMTVEDAYQVHDIVMVRNVKH